MYQLFTLVIMWLTGSRPWPASWDSIVLYNPSLGKIQNSHYAFYRMCIGVAPSKNQKIVSQGAFMFNKLHSTEHSIIHRLCIEWFCPAVASVNLSLLKVDRAKLCCLAAVIFSDMSDSFVTRCTVACRPSLSMGFPRQEYWVDCHFLLQRIFPTQRLFMSPVLQADYLPLNHLGSPCCLLD